MSDFLHMRPSYREGDEYAYSAYGNSSNREHFDDGGDSASVQQQLRIVGIHRRWRRAAVR